MWTSLWALTALAIAQPAQAATTDLKAQLQQLIAPLGPIKGSSAPTGSQPRRVQTCRARYAVFSPAQGATIRTDVQVTLSPHKVVLDALGNTMHIENRGLAPEPALPRDKQRQTVVEAAPDSLDPNALPVVMDREWAGWLFPPLRNGPWRIDPQPATPRAYDWRARLTRSDTWSAGPHQVAVWSIEGKAPPPTEKVPVQVEPRTPRRLVGKTELIDRPPRRINRLQGHFAIRADGLTLAAVIDEQPTQRKPRVIKLVESSCPGPELSEPPLFGPDQHRVLLLKRLRQAFVDDKTAHAAPLFADSLRNQHGDAAIAKTLTSLDEKWPSLRPSRVIGTGRVAPKNGPLRFSAHGKDVAVLPGVKTLYLALETEGSGPDMKISRLGIDPAKDRGSDHRILEVSPERLYAITQLDPLLWVAPAAVGRYGRLVSYPYDRWLLEVDFNRRLRTCLGKGPTPYSLQVRFRSDGGKVSLIGSRGGPCMSKVLLEADKEKRAPDTGRAPITLETQRISLWNKKARDQKGRQDLVELTADLRRLEAALRLGRGRRPPLPKVPVKKTPSK